MRFPPAAASAALLFVACATSSPPPAAGKPSSAEKPVVEVTSTGTPGEATAVRKQSLTATVRSVDIVARTVTLEWNEGGTGTFKVAPELTRFDEIYAGDPVRIDVEQQLRLELQPPGAATVPLTVADGARTTTSGGTVVATGFQSTVTVTAVDLATRIVTFKDPAGATYGVKAGPGLQIDKLEVGDRLLATYTEATAVKLEKAPRKP